MAVDAAWHLGRSRAVQGNLLVRSAAQGWYFAGDGARYGSDGEIWVLGRIDDVMNVSGHRISTAEVESALVAILQITSL
ncbi:MAG: acetyl-CoA synthetase [Mycobacterium sp.]|nr:acetyl-CoA synthetase [Mycobacterium sp.]